jgi:hypothetical protein
MSFDPSPNSWLTGYTSNGSEISFKLDADYTTQMQKPLDFILRVLLYLHTKYKNNDNKPVRWTPTVSYIQPSLAQPNLRVVITNKLTLEASLFGGVTEPPLVVTVSTPDMVYTGYAYSGLTATYPGGSTASILYSSDGGLTWSSTPPSAIGSHIAKVTATKDGRSGTARGIFSIIKTTVAVTDSGDLTISVDSQDKTINFYGSQPFTSVVSSDPSVASIVSFTSEGIVVVKPHRVGATTITARSSETPSAYPSEGALTCIVVGYATTITMPSTLKIPPSADDPYVFSDILTSFDKNNPTIYGRMSIGTSDQTIATVNKGTSFPPSINLLKPGTVSLIVSYPESATEQGSEDSTSVTIEGIPTLRNVSVSPSQEQSGGSKPFGPGWETTNFAGIILNTIPTTFTIKVS